MLEYGWIFIKYVRAVDNTQILSKNKNIFCIFRYFRGSASAVARAGPQVRRRCGRCGRRAVSVSCPRWTQRNTRCAYKLMARVWMSNVSMQGAGAVGPVVGRTPDLPTLRTVHCTHLHSRAKTKCISEIL